MISDTNIQQGSGRQTIQLLADILVLAAVEIFLFSKFDLASLFTATTTAGGDTASHYYTLQYLRETLLPAGRITGWTMGNYAGFPILQFYFPLPFLLMCLLDLVMPLQVAFKLVTLLGTALLPVSAYVMLRLIRCPFPGPGIGAVLMLPFLFNGANSMWGGNILSTLAGEFSYSLSMALSLILIGSLYRGALEGKCLVRNAVLVFLVGFSHGYTLLFVEAMSLFILITPYGFVRRALYLFKVYALGFCLLAFWLIPLLVFTKYTTSYHLVWTINSLAEIIPAILLPTFIFALAGAAILLIWGLKKYREWGSEMLPGSFYILSGLTAAIVFFVAAPKIGVVDIRYVPYGQLMVCLLAAWSFGWLSSKLLGKWRLNLLLLLVVTSFTLHWTGERLGPVKGWSKWNYEGFEAKKTWPAFDRINKKLKGNFQDPRVVFEHSETHNMFGSSRAFESLPLFAGRSTLEGLYMQASISAPFVFYIQSLVSSVSSQPFPQYNYGSMDFDQAGKYLDLFNVGDLIIKSAKAKQAIRKADGYRKTGSIKEYELWERTTNTDRYVEPLKFEPVLYKGQAPWKEAAFEWFTKNEPNGVHLIFETSGTGSSDLPAKLVTDSLNILPAVGTGAEECTIDEKIHNDEINIQTNCLNRPLLVKVSFHPNWQVEGAAGIFLVSPSFMLIYPQQENVRLFYGPGPWNRFGQLLTVIGIVILLLNVPVPGRSGSTAWEAVAARFDIKTSLAPVLPFDPSPGARKSILLAVLVLAGIVVSGFAYHAYSNEPYRIYKHSIQLKDSGRYEAARTGFRRFMDAYPLANLTRESAYYIAITYYLEKDDAAAIKSFEEYIDLYPQGSRVAEAYYHIGMSLFRSNQEEPGIMTMKMVRKKFPATPWAGYALKRLQEHDADK